MAEAVERRCHECGLHFRESKGNERASQYWGYCPRCRVLVVRPPEPSR